MTTYALPLVKPAGLLPLMLLVAACGSDSCGDLEAEGRMVRTLIATDRSLEAANRWHGCMLPSGAGVDEIIGFADIYAEHGELDRAAALYKLALSREPGDTYVLFSLGEAYEKLGDEASAAKYFRAVVDASKPGIGVVDGSNYSWQGDTFRRDALLRLGEMALRNRDPAATKWFSTSIAESPLSREAHVGKLRAYALIGAAEEWDANEAANWLLESLEADRLDVTPEVAQLAGEIVRRADLTTMCSRIDALRDTTGQSGSLAEELAPACSHRHKEMKVERQQ